MSDNRDKERPYDRALREQQETRDRAFREQQKSWSERHREEERHKERVGRALNITEAGMVLLIVGCIIGAIAVPTQRYYSATIKVQQAKTYMWEVHSSTNLTRMGDYFQKALDLLQPFSGQAVWIEAFVPTVDTDFDVIKANLQQAIDTCNAFADVPPTNTSYQWAVTNMQDLSDELADHLASDPSEGQSIQFWTTWNQATSGTFWLLIVGVIGSLITCVAVLYKKGTL